jgi:hypothetical protein
MRGRAIRLIGLVGFWLALLTVSPVLAGPVVSADYRLPAKLDPDIASDIETEIWATVWRPAALAAASYPIVVFLHGNHGTCR